MNEAEAFLPRLLNQTGSKAARPPLKISLPIFSSDEGDVEDVLTEAITSGLLTPRTVHRILEASNEAKPAGSCPTPPSGDLSLSFVRAKDAVKTKTPPSREPIPSEKSNKVAVVSPSIKKSSPQFCPVDYEMHLGKMRRGENERQHRGVMQRSMMCMMCHRKRKLADVFRLEKCCHCFCYSCLRTYSREVMKRGNVRNICCPLSCCSIAIDHNDLRTFLLPADFDSFISSALNALIENDPTFFRCPNPACHIVIERLTVDPSDIPGDGSIFSVDGTPLSHELIHHRAQHRFRCPKCDTEFCAGCSSVPYHLGFNCDEFKMYSTARHCRYCLASLKPLTAPLLPRKLSLRGRKRGGKSCIVDVCEQDECVKKLEHACLKTHSCGHGCIGIRGERKCLPCLNPNCNPSDNVETDFCNICWVEELKQSPCIKLECGHIFHYFCVENKLKQKWQGPRISFNFMNCPLCNQRISHPSLREILDEFSLLIEDVKQKAHTRLIYEGLGNIPEIKTQGSRFYNDPVGYAMDRFSYYQCYVCQRAYFGGQRLCEENEEKAFDPSELVCGGCSSAESKNSCKEHGSDFIEYKCCFCCNIATWYCWGRTHFCNDCHERQQKGEYLTKKPRSALPKCPGPNKCKVGMRHPPNGEEFSLGCALCRNSKSF